MTERGQCREGVEIAYSSIKNMYRRKNTHKVSAHMALLCLVCHLKNKYANQSSFLTNKEQSWEGTG